MAQKQIALLVTGGIASYKSLEVLRLLTEKGHDVHVMMTASACEFVRPLTFEVLSGNAVGASLFNDNKESEINHIKVAQKLDAILVAPATANVIGKLASGIADDLVTSTLLAANVPVVMAPAMNTQMWENQAVQKNIAYLKSIGINFIDPDSGLLACKTVGVGRLKEPNKIVAELDKYLSDTPLPFIGKKFLITAGPTIEPIDKFRFISNYSSGKMGYAIASAAVQMGAQVTLISGPTAISPPNGVDTIFVNSAEEMYYEVLSKSEKMDVIIKTAAVSDYSPEKVFDGKIKKTDEKESTVLKLKKNKDILQELGKRKKQHQILVGFCAETENLESEAKRKMKEKNLDMIVANEIGEKNSGFGGDNNSVLIVSKLALKKISSSKVHIGLEILNELKSVQ